MLSARSDVERTRSTVNGCEGRRYKLWWSGNSNGTGRVGVLVMEELCEKVVEVRRKSDRLMAVGMALEEEVVRIMCV